MKKLILLLCFFGVFFAGLSISDASIDPDPIEAGQSGIITATLESVLTTSSTGTIISGGDDLERIKVYVYNYGPTETTEEGIVIGDLGPGTSTQIAIPITAKEDAETGNYLVKVKVEAWVDKAGGGEEFTEESTILVARVLNSPLITLESNEDVIGENEEITIKIINEGGSVKDLRLQVNGDFAIKNKNEIYVGDLDNEIEVSFVLDASEAEAGANNVEINLEYKDGLGNSNSETKTMRFNIVKEESVISISQESEIVSNMENKLKLNIKNSGKNIENLKISFPNQDLKLKEIEKIEIESLNAEEEVEIEVEVFASLNPGINQIEAQLEWKENGEEKKDIVNVPFTVTSDVSIGIYLEGKPTPLTKGEEHSLVVLVSNLGSYEINNVDVSISGESFDLLDVQASEYIGEMDSDDFSTVQFKIEPTEIGIQNVEIEINYKDQSGEWIKETIVREVLVYEKEQEVDGLLFPAVGAIFILLILWHFKFRKK